MEKAGIPRAEVMQITGQKTESIYKRCDLGSEKGATEAGKRLRRFLAEREAEKRADLEKVGEKLGGKITEDAGRTDGVFASKRLN